VARCLATWIVACFSRYMEVIVDNYGGMCAFYGGNAEEKGVVAPDNCLALQATPSAAVLTIRETTRCKTGTLHGAAGTGRFSVLCP